MSIIRGSGINWYVLQTMTLKIHLKIIKSIIVQFSIIGVYTDSQYVILIFNSDLKLKIENDFFFHFEVQIMYKMSCLHHLTLKLFWKYLQMLWNDHSQVHNTNYIFFSFKAYFKNWFSHRQNAWSCWSSKYTLQTTNTANINLSMHSVFNKNQSGICCKVYKCSK